MCWSKLEGGCCATPHLPVHPLPTLLVLRLARSHPCNNTGSTASLITAVHKGEGFGEKGSQRRQGTGRPLSSSFSPPVQERARVSGCGLSRRVTQQERWCLSLLTWVLLTCTLMAQHPEKETESTHIGFWGTSPGTREMPSVPLARESKRLLPLAEKPTRPFRAAPCTGGNGEVCKARQRDVGERHACTRRGQDRTVPWAGWEFPDVLLLLRAPNPALKHGAMHAGLQGGYKCLTHKLLPPAQPTPPWLGDVSVCCQAERDLGRLWHAPRQSSWGESFLGCLIFL